MSRKCPNCSAGLSPEARFCPRCGASLADVPLGPSGEWLEQLRQAQRVAEEARAEAELARHEAEAAREESHRLRQQDQPWHGRRAGSRTGQDLRAAAIARAAAARRQARQFRAMALASVIMLVGAVVISGLTPHGGWTLDSYANLAAWTGWHVGAVGAFFLSILFAVLERTASERARRNDQIAERQT